MWVLLSSRIRTWIALAIAVPIARSLVRRAAAVTARRNPNAPAARLLHQADIAITAGSNRLGRRGRRSRA